MYQQRRKSKILSVSQNAAKLNIPLKVDWRKKNVITDVEDQGTCGACWAFAAIEIAESMYGIKTGKLKNFSVQEMIDCDKSNDGCQGGDVFLLLDWLKTENITIATEEEYPTKLTEGECKMTSSEGLRIASFDCGK